MGDVRFSRGRVGVSVCPSCRLTGVRLSGCGRALGGLGAGDCVEGVLRRVRLRACASPRGLSVGQVVSDCGEVGRLSGGTLGLGWWGGSGRVWV